MHYTAMENGRAFFEAYVKRLGRVFIVDVGAQDVNGSLRSACPPEATYTGVDVVPGKGVDLLMQDAYSLPFADDSQDVVVSTSCFEHTEMFWLVFNEVLRILKPAGLFYLNAPSNGVVHRYPVDCWRFYPDSGHALIAWARRSGMNAALLESYISCPINTQFEDFVAVFVKDEGKAGAHPHRILDTFGDYISGISRQPDGSMQQKQGPESLPEPVAVPPVEAQPRLRALGLRGLLRRVSPRPKS